MSRDALIIGINQYKYLKLLDSPATDAEAIAQILEHQGGFTINRLPASEDIDAENRSIVTVADSGEITLPELKNALVQLFNPTSQKPPEVALFYFSGHGLREDQGGIQQGFLATTHSETKSYNNCLPLDWLRKLLRNSPVRQQIVWLDCCYSGELFNFAEADPGQRDQGLDRCFIAASRDFEAAIAPRTSDHSLFTEALLQALDYNQSAHGYIDNYQLAENLKQILKTSSFPQQPVYGNSGERPIVLTGWMYATKPAFGEDFCPYKGLHYFDNKPEDALFFKGREKLIAELLTKVTEKSFLAILGASGNGKSSVVRAGVLYQLQQTERWQIVNPFTPTANPLTALTNGLGTTDVLTLVTSTKARVILTIDQFEEVFSLCQDPQARDTFFNTLLDAVEQATGKFCLIVVMRADFMDKCSQYPRLARYFQDHQHIVTRPTEAEIQQIIEAPAKQAGFLVEPRLVAEMVTDFKDSLGGLPLLEFALTTLWEKGKADRLLRYADYQALGRIQGILEKKATDTYEELTPAEQVVAKRIFLELTELGEGRHDTRRLVPQTDLLSFATRTASPSRTGSPEPSVEQVIAQLAKEHLIVTDKTEVTVVNIAHDALIEHWSVLRQWLDQSRDDLKLQRQINEGAKAWQAGEKALLVDIDLAIAEKYLTVHTEKVSLSEEGVKFVQASVASRHRELQRKRRNRRLAMLAGVGVVVLLAGWLWREVEQSKKIEQSLKVATEQKNIALRAISAITYDVVARLQSGKTVTSVLVELLDDNVKLLNDIAAVDPNSRETQREKAVNLSLVGDSWLILGNVPKARTVYQQASDILKRLAAADPSNTEAQRDVSVSYSKLGDVQLQLGDTQAALTAYQQSFEIRKRLAAADPSNTQAQRDVSVSYSKLGQVQLQLGDTQAALTAYQQSLEMDKRLAAADPSNTQAQRDVSVSYSKLGDVQLQLGDTQAALTAYQQSLEMDKRLAAADPSNTQAQRDVSVSYSKLGQVQLQLGDTQAALTAYQQSFEIRKRLAAADPSNTQAQRDVSVSYSKLGQVQLQLGDTQAALTAFQQSFEIRKRLAAADPSNTQAQRDVSVSYSKLGQVQLQLGDTQAALTAFQQSFEIRKRLAAADPSNTEAQRDVSVSYSKLGDVQLQLGDTQAALTAYQQSLEMDKRLAAADPSNTQAQRDVSVSYSQLGQVQLQLGDTQAALTAFQQSFEIRKRLAAADPSNTQAQRDVSVSYSQLGQVQLQLGDTQAALTAFQQSFEIRKRLAAADPSNTQAQQDLAFSYERLGDVNLRLGESQSALKVYQQEFEILEKLARNDPTSSAAQRALSVSYSKLGQVQLQLGDTQAALTAYQQSLEMDKRLAAADPSNTQAQRDLYASYGKLGQVHEKLGQPAKALDFYRQAQPIAEQRSAHDPADKQAQEDLAVVNELVKRLQEEK